MSSCPSCGGILGRDCFNPVECGEIGHQQDQQRMQHEQEMMRFDHAALSAATQALTDMGCELREGAWMKRSDCPGPHMPGRFGGNVWICGSNEQCDGSVWLPITRQSGGEGGAG